MARRPRAPAAAAERKPRRDIESSSIIIAPRGRRLAARWRSAGRRHAVRRLPDAERGVEDRALHGVSDGAAEGADARVVARRVHAVGEEDDEELLLGIRPDRGAGEAGVAEAARREVLAGARARRRVLPAQPARGVLALARRPARDRLGMEDADAVVLAAVE